MGELARRITRLVGRHRELRELAGLLGAQRIVTVLGPGGVGKTRLAIAAAERHPTYAVDLSGTSAVEVEAEVAAALGVNPGAADPVPLIAELMSERPALLVLDNCEHVVAIVADLTGRLVRACPDLTVLATSREPVGIEGETVYRLPPLDPAAAVELFTERARAADPAFAADEHVLDELCRRLDGIPLAIELAAPWVRLFTPAEMLPRLPDLLHGTGRDRPARHQSLRATIESSYRLLSPERQRLFQRLAVFAGTFDLHAAEHVCDATPADLAALLDRSFLTVERVPPSTRYRMLETLRQFAEPVGHRRHAEYFRTRAERVDEYRTATGCDAGIAELVPDASNYRAALAWSIEHAPETALRLAAALEGFWMIRSVGEGQRWVRLALDRAPAPTRYRARALMVLPVVITTGGAGLGESRELFRQAGDPVGAALAELTMSLAAFFTGDLTEALEHADAPAVDHPFVRARRSCYRGAALAFTAHRFADARAALEDAVERTAGIGDGWGHGVALTLLGLAELRAGHRQAAAEHLKAALDGDLRGGVTAAAIGGLGLLCRTTDPPRARLLLHGATAVRERAGVPRLPVPIERMLAVDGPAVRRLSTDELVELARADDRPPKLTARQYDVATMVAEGLSNREIAARLHLSVRTVETHVEHCLARLGLRRRIDLAGWIRDQRP